MKPTWLPDWRDASAYSHLDPETTTGAQWAWEFLRRNENYQKDYAQWAKVPKRGPESVAYIKAMLERHIQEGKPLEGQHFENPVHVIGRKYGLQTMFGVIPDPANDKPRLMFEPLFFSMTDWLYEQKINQASADLGLPRSASTPPLQEGEVRLIIDVRYPIKRQINQAMPMLKDLQKSLLSNASDKRPGGKKVRLYQNYLRVLDADVSRATPKEMEVIFSERAEKDRDFDPDDPVRSSLIAAGKLRDRDYIWLLFLEQNQGRK